MSARGTEEKLVGATTHRVVVREGGTGRDPALRHSNGAVHVGRAIHEKTMPVQARGLVSEPIVNVHDDLVSFVGLKGGNGPLVVDAHDRAHMETIRISKHPGDVVIKIDRVGVDRSQPGLKKQQPRHKKIGQ